MNEVDVLVVEDDPIRMAEIKKFLIGYSYSWATTAKEGIELLKKNKYTFVMLDHDLSFEHYNQMTYGEGTGQEVANWIAQNKPDIDGVLIHSLNHTGAEYMWKTLDKVDIPVIKVPMVWKYLYGDFYTIITKNFD